MTEAARSAILDEAAILRLVAADPWCMVVLRHAAALGLPDWWIVAGFLRNRVWDHLHGFTEPTPLNDVDLVFFDPDRPPDDDRALEVEARRRAPDVPWEIYNQAHMHTFNGHAPYSSSVDSFSRWAESVSTIGIRLDADGQLRLAAPHGIHDLVHMIVRATPHPDARHDVFLQRVEEKDWLSRWPRARVLVG